MNVDEKDVFHESYLKRASLDSYSALEEISSFCCGVRKVRKFCSSGSNYLKVNKKASFQSSSCHLCVMFLIMHCCYVIPIFGAAECLPASFTFEQPTVHNP